MKVFSGIDSITPPDFSEHKDDEGHFDYNSYNKAEEAYSNAVKEYCKKHGKGKYRGAEVNFPVADGYATYIIFKNSELIHLALGDAYEYQYIERLTVKDIQEKADQWKKWQTAYSGGK